MATNRNERKNRLWLRRIICAVLALAMVMSFAGCKDKEEEEPTGGLSSVIGQKDEGGDDTGDETEAPQEETAEEVTEPEVIPLNGWIIEEGKTYYYIDDAAQTGFFLNEEPGFYDSIEFATGWYYFDEEGVMCAGCWIEHQGDSYYLTDNGLTAAEGWYGDSKGWYHLEDMGKLTRNSVWSQDGTEYSVNSEGYLYQVRHDSITGTNETGTVGDSENKTYMVFADPIVNCLEFNFHLSGDSDKTVDISSIWNLWLRCDGEWVRMKDHCDILVVEGTVSVKFQEPVEFDAVCWMFALGIVQKELEPVITDVVIRY